jgi:hypothetical protein
MRLLSAAKSLLAAAVAFQAAAAHNIVLSAHGVDCFYEMLHKGDSMTVTFQVGDREFGSAGNLEIDFWVRQNQSPFG